MGGAYVTRTARTKEELQGIIASTRSSYEARGLYLDSEVEYIFRETLQKDVEEWRKLPDDKKPMHLKLFEEMLEDPNKNVGHNFSVHH